ncbi:glutamate-5-semialdehyde dehydrogenase [Sandarakinorhabdus sp.]|uniref:glutamate-5-semialdehyde dehydrogenase n=1 Tax=Sandarakinorhabdus sp. TaxID=1916663 RepID=UPI003341CAA6
MNLINDMARAARAALPALAAATTAQKSLAITAAAAAIRGRMAELLAANAADMAAAQASSVSAALQDRLALDAGRAAGIAAGLDAVAGLTDPVGEVIAQWAQPNGLQFSRVRVPLGVIGIIYESRPGVTADAAALCLMAGNACLLRGGSEAALSNAVLLDCVAFGLRSAGLPAAAVQMVPAGDRALVGQMLSAHGLIDVIIPRGGKGLIARVQQEARVPVLAHLDGINHVYVDASADPDQAVAIVMNSKLRRTAVCGAMETLLIDAAAPLALKQRLLAALLDGPCEVRGDAAVQAIDARVIPAVPQDFHTEYIAAIASAAEVAGVDDAIAHIQAHGSQHTECVVARDAAVAERFLGRVDAAIVLHNASTQFADGGEFGFGAEIGIATGRLHARGPVALPELTIFKTLVRGTGQVRP